MTQTRRVRQFPIWLSALIILAMVAGAAWLIRWFITTGPTGTEVVVLDRGPEDGVKALPGGRNWRAQSGNNGLRVSKDSDGQLHVDFYVLHYDFLTPEQFNVLNNGRRIAADPALADELGLSPKQREDLREQVKRGFNLELSEPDRKRLTDLFQDYLAASPAAKEGREADLLHGLDSVGDRVALSARRATLDASSRIQTLLTADQWKKFNQ